MQRAEICPGSATLQPQHLPHSSLRVNPSNPIPAWKSAVNGQNRRPISAEGLGGWELRECPSCARVFHKAPHPSAAPRHLEAKPWARGGTPERFPRQYSLHLSAAALPPTLLSRERLNFLLRGRTALGALGAKAPRNTRGFQQPTRAVGAGGSRGQSNMEAALLPDTRTPSQWYCMAGQALPLLLRHWRLP